MKIMYLLIVVVLVIICSIFLYPKYLYDNYADCMASKIEGAQGDRGVGYRIRASKPVCFKYFCENNISYVKPKQEKINQCLKEKKDPLGFLLEGIDCNEGIYVFNDSTCDGDPKKELEEIASYLVE